MNLKSNIAFQALCKFSEKAAPYLMLVAIVGISLPTSSSALSLFKSSRLYNRFFGAAKEPVHSGVELSTVRSEV